MLATHRSRCQTPRLHPRGSFSLLIIGFLLVLCPLLAQASKTAEDAGLRHPILRTHLNSQGKPITTMSSEAENSIIAQRIDHRIRDSGPSLYSSTGSISSNNILPDELRSSTIPAVVEAHTPSHSIPTKAWLLNKRLLQGIPRDASALSTSSDGEIVLPDGALGVPYRVDLKSYNLNDFTFSSPTNLPSELQLRNSLLTGTPKVFGRFTFYVMVSDGQRTVKQPFQIFIQNMDVKVRGNLQIHNGETRTFTLEVKYGLPPVSLAMSVGPDWCDLQDRTLLCTPDRTGKEVVSLRAVDNAGNGWTGSITLDLVDDTILKIRNLGNLTLKDRNNPANSDFVSHNTLRNITTKCPIPEGELEFYSNVQTMLTRSLNLTQITLVGGIVLTIQPCTIITFVPTIRFKELLVGCKLVFAGLVQQSPQKYLATKILKIAD